MNNLQFAYGAFFSYHGAWVRARKASRRPRMGGRLSLTLAWALALSGCTTYYWGPFPVEVTPVPTVEADAWPDEVADAAEVWNELLPCRPFVFGTDDGYPVELVPLNAWTDGRDEYHVADYVGLTYDDHIEIRGDIPKHTRKFILMHEFGHAMGLEHSSDPTSVMWHGNDDNLPNAKDVVAALASLRVHGQECQ